MLSLWFSHIILIKWSLKFNEIIYKNMQKKMARISQAYKGVLLKCEGLILKDYHHNLRSVQHMSTKHDDVESRLASITS